MAELLAIVSGGQTGVDQAALRAGQDCGLETGGWCPPGRECESGVIPARFPLKETPEDRSPDAPEVPRSLRSEWNVRASDATLILRPAVEDRVDPGTGWTVQCAVRYGRPLLVCDPANPVAQERITSWLRALSVRNLHVAGPSEGACPGVGDQAYALLVRVFSTLRLDPPADP